MMFEGSEKSKLKKRKKHKKEKLKKSKKNKKKASDMSSSSSSEDEWVEKPSSTEAPRKEVRDEWMSMTGLFPCVSQNKIRQEREQEKERKKEEKKQQYEEAYNARELNPYWKDGGSGLPKEDQTKESSPRTMVGDGGLGYLLKGYQRVQELAKEEGRSVEEVAAERWGSLQALEMMISDAKLKMKLKEEGPRSKEAPRNRRDEKHSPDRQRDYRKDKRREYNKRSSSSEEEREASRHRQGKKYHEKRNDREHLYRRDYKDRDRRREKDFVDRNKPSSKPSLQESDDKKTFRRPSDDSYEIRTAAKYRVLEASSSDKNRDSKLTFKKPSDDGHYEYKTKQRISYEGRKAWQKKDSRDSQVITSKSRSPTPPHSEEVIEESQSSENDLTEKEMNSLAAKIIKAELMGKDELVQKLKEKLELARKFKASKANQPTVVALTKTDAKGFSHPLKAPDTSVQKTKKHKKLQSHESGERVRYFPDDDGKSLQSMFQSEKQITAAEQNSLYGRLASAGVRGIGANDDDVDMDDIFLSRTARKEDPAKQAERERNKAIKEHRAYQRSFEKCKFCFDSKLMMKHLIISLGKKVYLCLPDHLSLAEGHCLLSPISHIPSATRLDEDVWEELMMFRRALVKMFLSDDMDCVFFECVTSYRSFPHMVLHCVPLPKDVGNFAPMYFKKAILESEAEWAMNKKIVDLKGKDIRKAVPKELPYFSVDFGMDPGFAHVIEDEKDFPRNFAQEVIGGLLDLDHSLWRKPVKEKPEDVIRKVNAFSNSWKEYDFTRDDT